MRCMSNGPQMSWRGGGRSHPGHQVQYLVTCWVADITDRRMSLVLKLRPQPPLHSILTFRRWVHFGAPIILSHNPQPDFQCHLPLLVVIANDVPRVATQSARCCFVLRCADCAVSIIRMQLRIHCAAVNQPSFIALSPPKDRQHESQKQSVTISRHRYITIQCIYGIYISTWYMYMLLWCICVCINRWFSNRWHSSWLPSNEECKIPLPTPPFPYSLALFRLQASLLAEWWQTVRENGQEYLQMSS